MACIPPSKRHIQNDYEDANADKVWARTRRTEGLIYEEWGKEHATEVEKEGSRGRKEV
jgi:hypothetical protein